MLKPKKSLGQNFLIDKNICRKIVNLTQIKNNDIVEIGPGTGLLTDEIIKHEPKNLLLIEKDYSLILNLKEKYREHKNIEIINDDILNFTFTKKKEKIKIISNLPYNISTQIIFNLLSQKNTFSEMILMIQKEVAEKMSVNKQKKMNRLNLLIEVFSKYNIEFNVSNNCFFPKPKVMSSVIRITPKNSINIDINKFEIFTRNIFKHKRKKISHVNKLINFDKNNKFDKFKDQRFEDLGIDELLFFFKEFYSF